MSPTTAKCWYVVLLVLSVAPQWTAAFSTCPMHRQHPPSYRGFATTTTKRVVTNRPARRRTVASSASSSVRATGGDEDESGEAAEDDGGPSSSSSAGENPYQDPNYPDLEFVDYSDPEYRADRGAGGDEFFDPESAGGGGIDGSTEEQVEAMREERRMQNDEYQFETYYKEVLKDGGEFKGEWSVFTTSTFTDGTTGQDGRPRLARAAGPLRVISRGERIELERGPASDGREGATDRLEYERILHHERVFAESEEGGEKSADLLRQEEISMGAKFWPAELSSRDFRGQQGIMCVGNAYTICTAVPLSPPPPPSESSSDGGSSSDADAEAHRGPFAEYRAELGLLAEVMRFRVKMDYAVRDDDRSLAMPPLHLRSLTVCRETLGMWPRAERYKSAIEAVTQDALWGPRGAGGGLYDPPPVGSEEQAGQYLLLDLEGRATVLLPYLMDQDPDAHPGSSGWVTSLDWTPGKNRFQVDRKTTAGRDLLGLRTLELSEVESESAERYRPRDGGSNMRQ